MKSISCYVLLRNTFDILLNTKYDTSTIEEIQNKLIVLWNDMIICDALPEIFNENTKNEIEFICLDILNPGFYTTQNKDYIFYIILDSIPIRFGTKDNFVLLNQIKT